METIALSSVCRMPGWVPSVRRETLLPEVAREVGLAAFERWEEPGAVSELASDYGITRSMVYRLGEKVEQRWEAFEAQAWDVPTAWRVHVNRAQVVRATLGARVDANCSVREIMALHDHFYGLDASFGFVQGVVSKGSQKAGEVLGSQRLGSIQSAALDELFSQEEPVLVGIDLDSEYVFLLRLAPDRSAETWRRELDALKPRGLSLECFVSDAGKGVVHGAQRCFPDADSRRDNFHVLDVLFDALGREERYAYAKLEEEVKAERKVASLCEGAQREKADAHRGRGRPRKTELEDRLAIAQAELELIRVQAAHQVARHDRLLRIVRRTLDALQPVGRDGILRTSQAQSALLKELADKLAGMKGKRLTKAATYLRNCSEGVSSYIDDVASGLRALASDRDELDAVTATAVLWRLGREERQKSMAFRRGERLGELRMLVDCLSHLPLDGERMKTLMRQTEWVLERCARASSLAECMNSVLRPYLAVHKRVTQEALDLFCARWNFQVRDSGRLKGTSPFTALTGIKVQDWLSVIGAPATHAVH